LLRGHESLGGNEPEPLQRDPEQHDGQDRDADRPRVKARHRRIAPASPCIASSAGSAFCSAGAQLSAGCSHLARRLSGPALERVREGADLVKAEQPRDFRYMQLPVLKVSNREVLPQILKYFAEV
jgi:hypothetical protein